jgi:CheY-like chemotaxis protein
VLGHRHRILVIDDDPGVRDALDAAFRMEGYGVATAAHGQHALDRLRDGLEPCVILLDLAMPVKDGWQFRREQATDPHLARIPVIVCSASDPGDPDAPALGVEHHLRKPLGVDEVLAVIERYCEQESPRLVARVTPGA